MANETATKNTVEFQEKKRCSATITVKYAGFEATPLDFPEEPADMVKETTPLPAVGVVSIHHQFKVFRRWRRMNHRRVR